jgi:predicted dehydrogenase
MRVLRSIGSFALLTLLLCSSVAAQGGSPQLLARWTIYQVSGVGQDTWSTWYAQGPFPVHFRFKCSNGTVIVNAQNTDKLTQNVTIRYWDVERDQRALENAIGSKKALQNRGFALQPRQAILQPILRPDACSATSNSFVFGAYLGV